MINIHASFCEKNGFQKISELPWGSPVYRANWKGKQIDIACYKYHAEKTSLACYETELAVF